MLLVRSVAYEVIIAALSIADGWRILTDPTIAVSAISRHAPHWEVVGFAVGLIVGGLVTLVAILLSGLLDNPVSRTMGHRFEEAGQILLAGMFVAPALAAFQLGSFGYVQGVFDLGVSAAALCRVVQIHKTFSATTIAEMP